MHPVLRKMFGGLSQAYFLRELFFGLIMAACVCGMASFSSASLPLTMGFFVIANTVLYPYARFVVESIAGAILGEKVLFASAGPVMGVKIVAMILCWAGAVLIVPPGLAYLYFHHSKTKGQEV